MALKITRGYMGGFPLLTLAGESDEKSVADLGENVREHFPVGKVNYYCDLSGLHFMDSLFIGFLVSLNISIEETGESMIFLNPSSEVRQIFSVTNVDRILKVQVV